MEMRTEAQDKELIKRLEEEYKMEVILLFWRKHSFEECYEAIEAFINKLMAEGEEYVYFYAVAIEIYDKTPSGELWVRFWQH